MEAADGLPIAWQLKAAEEHSQVLNTVPGAAIAPRRQLSAWPWRAVLGAASMKSITATRREGVKAAADMYVALA